MAKINNISNNNGISQEKKNEVDQSLTSKVSTIYLY